MRTLLALAIAGALIFSTHAIADGIFNPSGSTGTTTVGGGEGINNLSIGGSGGGGGGCNGAINLSSGCKLPMLGG